jgi:hypothetical protein
MPESSYFNAFWMPDQVRHDGAATFYAPIKIGSVQHISLTEKYKMFGCGLEVLRACLKTPSKTR